jgi:hypothetical protein
VSLPAVTARADDHGTGFEAGLRAGYAIPLGKVRGNSNTDLNDVITDQIPLWLDVGYRAVPELFVGLYGQYGFGFVGEGGCGSGVDCSAVDTRLGVQVHIHPAPESSADGWLGIGFGYEWMTVNASGMGVEVSGTLHGFELLNLQTGVDIKVAENFRVGPAVSFSLGQYGATSLSCSSSVGGCGPITDQSDSISNKALHEWLFFGVRGVYGP